MSDLHICPLNSEPHPVEPEPLLGQFMHWRKMTAWKHGYLGLIFGGTMCVTPLAPIGLFMVWFSWPWIHQR